MQIIYCTWTFCFIRWLWRENCWYNFPISLKYFRVRQPENCVLDCVQPGPVSWFFMDLYQHDSAPVYHWHRCENILHRRSWKCHLLHRKLVKTCPFKTLFRFPLWHISHNFGCDVLLPDPGISRGPECCFWCSQDRCYTNSYTGMGWVFFVFVFLPEFKFPKVTDWAPIHIFCLCTRWSEGILSSSSFLVVWRKCTTSQLCSLFSICGVLLRFLGKYAFSYCLQ